MGDDKRTSVWKIASVKDGRMDDEGGVGVGGPADNSVNKL